MGTLTHYVFNMQNGSLLLLDTRGLTPVACSTGWSSNYMVHVYVYVHLDLVEIKHGHFEYLKVHET